MSGSYEDEEDAREGIAVTTDLVLYSIPIPNEEEAAYPKQTCQFEAYVEAANIDETSFEEYQYEEIEAIRSVGNSMLHIQVVDRNGGLPDTVALLDTSCLYGNWVSTRKVSELGLEKWVVEDMEEPVMLAADGGEVRSQDSITLNWKVTNVGTRFFSTLFFLVDADHIDIIFGAEFLFSNGVVQIVINKNALAPFLRYYKPSPSVVDS